MSIGQINLIRYAVREATRIALKEQNELSIIRYTIHGVSYHSR